MKWYVRWGLVACIGVTTAFIACETPQHVARCVERCEKIQAGCFYNDTTLDNGVRWCRCTCSWPTANDGSFTR